MDVVDAITREQRSPRRRPNRRHSSAGNVNKKPPRISRRLGHLLRPVRSTGSKSEDVSSTADEEEVLFGENSGSENSETESYSPIVTRRQLRSSASADIGHKLYPILASGPLPATSEPQYDEEKISPYAALNQAYQELEELWLKQIHYSLLNDEDTLRSICTHSQQEDPITSREKRVWKKKESVGKVDPATKKIEKSIVEDDRKIGAREYHSKTLIAGCPEGQWVFRSRVASESEKGHGELRNRFRLGYLQVACEVVVKAIQALQRIELYSQLPGEIQSISNKFPSLVEKFVSAVKAPQEKDNIYAQGDQLFQQVQELYQCHLIQQTVQQECFFHPQKPDLDFIFSNLRVIANGEFDPAFSDFVRLQTLCPTENSTVWAKIGSLRYKLIWTDVFSGRMGQWIRLFDDSEILMYWLNLSSIDATKNSINQLKLVASATKSKDCAFLFLLDGDKLEKIGEKEDLTPHFRGFKKEKQSILEYVEHFCTAQLNKAQKPNFKVYCDRVDSENAFDFKSFLNRSYTHMKGEEKQMALSESLHGISAL